MISSPGPWTATSSVVRDEGGWLIANCKTETLTPEEVEGNARLIAAAPDLLAACLMAREELLLGGDWEAAKATIDRAVKKARRS